MAIKLVILNIYKSKEMGEYLSTPKKDKESIDGGNT
jgi:hypothetical protein